MPTPDQNEIADLAEEFESRTAEDILSWALERFGPGVVLASSFGPEDVALIHMLSGIRPGAGVITLDTGNLFKETLALIEEITERYDIDLKVIKPCLSIEEMEAKYGKELFKKDPSLCCRIRKVEPLREALSSFEAWITGIRREQTPSRAQSRKIEYDHTFRLVKLNPLSDWREEDVWAYVREHDVPYNPLHDRNYPSIGCEPCTRPVKPGACARDGRWAGREKTECGLHLEGA